jgi:EmrB/QacA subfamily drug resistance transporter
MTTHDIHPASAAAYADSPRARRSPLAALRASQWAPLPVVLAGLFIVVLDFFIVNVALPKIQLGLHASGSSIEFVTAGYALTSAVFLICGARLGDRLGRRRMFCAGLALFTLASAACGVAGTATELVAARLVQGVAGALLMPNVLSLIGVAYTGENRVKALSWYGLTMGLAAVSGQLIGGLLVQWNPAGLGWRSCFLINIPIGVLALVLAPQLVRESREPHASGVDWLGTALVTTGLTAIVFPLVEGRQHGWPLWTWLSLAASPLLLGGFVARQRQLARVGREPLLDLSLFEQRAFSAGLFTQMVFWSGQASFFLVLALYMQEGRGLSALDAGLLFTVLAVSYLAASMRSPALVAKHGRGVLTAAALTLATGHLTLLAGVAVIGVHGSVAVLVPGLLLIGAGMGLAIAPLATIIMSAMRPEQAGAASGALATFQNVGNAIGVAVIGVVFYGALHGGFAAALEWSLGALALILIGVAALTRLLPAQVRS